MHKGILALAYCGLSTSFAAFAADSAAPTPPAQDLPGQPNAQQQPQKGPDAPRFTRDRREADAGPGRDNVRPENTCRCPGCNGQTAARPDARDNDRDGRGYTEQRGYGRHEFMDRDHDGRPDFAPRGGYGRPEFRENNRNDRGYTEQRGYGRHEFMNRDHDGRPDFAARGGYSRPEFRENDRDGRGYTEQRGYGRHEFMDRDHDGRPDFAPRGGYGRPEFRDNDRDGRGYTEQRGYGRHEFMDRDHDGRPDFAPRGGYGRHDVRDDVRDNNRNDRGYTEQRGYGRHEFMDRDHDGRPDMKCEEPGGAGRSEAPMMNRKNADAPSPAMRQNKGERPEARGSEARPEVRNSSKDPAQPEPRRFNKDAPASAEKSNVAPANAPEPRNGREFRERRSDRRPPSADPVEHQGEAQTEKPGQPGYIKPFTPDKESVQ